VQDECDGERMPWWGQRALSIPSSAHGLRDPVRPLGRDSHGVGGLTRAVQARCDAMASGEMADKGGGGPKSLLRGGWRSDDKDRRGSDVAGGWVDEIDAVSTRVVSAVAVCGGS
jgi:hypothetical protein